MTTLIRAGSAHELLALIPRLAGYQPESSFVCVAFTGNRTVGLLRYDLPSRSSDFDAVIDAALATCCRIDGVDAVVPVVFSRRRFSRGRPPELRLLSRFVDRADQTGFLVRDALSVGANGWASIFDAQVPATGHPLDLIERSAAAFGPEVPIIDAADAAALVPWPDRSETLADALSTALCALDTIMVADDTNEASGDLLDRLGGDLDPIEFGERVVRGPDGVDAERLAWLVHLCSRPAVRDALMLQFAFGAVVGEIALDDAEALLDRAKDDESALRDLCDSHDENHFTGSCVSELMSRMIFGQVGARPDVARMRAAIEVLVLAAAHAPAERTGGVLCVIAWMAWALGRGSAAAAMLDRALHADPSHSMAALLRTFFGSGALPDWAFSVPVAQ